MNNNQNIERKMAVSAKWSSLGEIFAKLISPITNMILARLLLPEDFGIVATITMIVSFADMFTDAGFQKYIIQADIEEKELNLFANVAFWTNLVTSLLIWSILFFSRNIISILLGISELKNILPIATISIVISSLSMIQIGLFRRDFQFKKLFIIRVIGLFIPVLITIPLALFGFKFWSIIFGNIALAITNAVLLTILSKWKPKLEYNFFILKKMLSFSIWTLVEGITIWLTSWIDTFLISTRLTKKELGIYKTSTTNVNGIMSLITGATTPILFSGLSRLKDNDTKFFNVFLKMQKYVAIFVVPLGVGIFVFRKFATQILLGNGWDGASEVVGYWAITSSIMIVFGNYCSEVYRSKGKPKLSVLAQVLHLIFLIPMILWSLTISFDFMVISRSLARLQFVLIHFIIIKIYFNFSILKILSNVKFIILSSVLMGIFGYACLLISDSLWIQIFWVILCIVFYFFLLYLFQDTRNDVLKLLTFIRKKDKI